MTTRKGKQAMSTAPHKDKSKVCPDYMEDHLKNWLEDDWVEVVVDSYGNRFLKLKEEL
jgi:hypothetical protein